MPLWFIEGMAEYLSVGPDRLAHRDVDARRRAQGEAAHDPRPGRRRGTSRIATARRSGRTWPARFGDQIVAQGAGRRRPAQRTTRRRSSRRSPGVDDEAALQGLARRDPRGANAARSSGSKDPDALRPGADHREAGGRQPEHRTRAEPGRRSGWPSCPSATCSRSSCSSPTPHRRRRRSGSRGRLMRSPPGEPAVHQLGGRLGPRRQAPGAGRGQQGPAAARASWTPRAATACARCRCPTLGEIYTPSFSPDGAARGVLGAGRRRHRPLRLRPASKPRCTRLTEDAYADLQPAWSPDGTHDRLRDRPLLHAPRDARHRQLRLAALDVRHARGAPAARLRGRPRTSTRSGRRPAAACTSCPTRTGITNVYRLDVADGALFQLTDLITGVSGITALSPALSVAAARGPARLQRVRRRTSYEIYSIDDAERLAGWRVEPTDGAERRADPRRARHRRGAGRARRRRRAAWRRRTSSPRQPYKPKLTPRLRGPDLRGRRLQRPLRHLLRGRRRDVVQRHARPAHARHHAPGGPRARLQRRRRDRRLHQQGPPLQLGRAGRADPVHVRRVQHGRRSTAAASRCTSSSSPPSACSTAPSRCSATTPSTPSLRVEAHDRLPQHRLRDAGRDPGLLHPHGQPGHRRAGDDSRPRHHAPVRRTRSALVRDTSVFGATSPVLGQRFRLDVSPTLGSVNYTGALADLRQYVMPVRPVTLAARVLHYGRYGSGAEDPRLGAALPRLPEPGPRLRQRLVHRLGVRRRRRLPGLRPAPGQPAAGGQLRGAGAAVRPVRRAATCTGRSRSRSAPSSTPAWPGTRRARPRCSAATRRS